MVSLIGSVVERPTNKPSAFKPLNAEASETGFPPVKHRGKSAFLKSRQGGERVHDIPKVESEIKPPKNWREEISRENELKVAAMTDEERERERREIIERFGEGISDILKRAKAARAKTESDEVPISAESPKPSTSPKPALLSLSADNSRPSTPRSARRLRFAELAPTDVHVYESAPPSPKKKTVLALPPPDGSSDTISLGSYNAQPEQGTPEDIRRRFFPSAPADNPDIEWMKNVPDTSTDSGATRFDLAGNPIPPKLSQTLPTHLGLHHHAEGTHAGYTLDDVFLLVRSTVPAQRSAMLGILAGIARLLHKDQDKDPTLEDLYAKAPIILKQILFAALEALGERGSVGARAIQVIWECLVKTEVNQADVEFHYGGSALPSTSSHTDPLILELDLNLILPQISKVLASPPDSDQGVQTRTQRLLLSLLHHLARCSNSIAETIVQTSRLVGNVVDVFLFSSSKSEPRALDFLLTLISASRMNAKALIEMDIPNALLQFLVPVGDTDIHSLSILEKTLRVYITLGRYGMGTHVTHDASEVWRRMETLVDQFASAPPDILKLSIIETWSSLLEIWIICATDPHCTTPDHDILWSQVSAWGWGEDLMGLVFALRSNNALRDNPVIDAISMFSALWRAITAWLEGCRINGVKSGEKERSEWLQILSSGFQSGLEGQIVDASIDGLMQSLRIPDTSRAALYAHALTSVVRSWLSCIPDGPLSSPPFTLPFSKISELCAHLATHTVWTSVEQNGLKALSRPLASTLYHYLELSKRLPDVSQDLWMAQAFSIVIRMQQGDENYALTIVDELVGMINVDWVRTRQVFVPNEIWDKGGLGVIMPFLRDIIVGRSLATLPDEEGESAPMVVISPLIATTHSVSQATTLRIPEGKVNDNRQGCYGLPLRRDWALFPIDRLLKLTSAMSTTTQKEILVPSPWTASETDIVRATLLFARIGAVSLGQYDILKATVTPSKEEIVFACMKVFMLEHGFDDDGTSNGEEVFRDRVVASLMERLLHPYTLGASTPSSASGNLEDVATLYLGPSTPFYQFYTDFVALYDAISYSHPLFSRLLLPPTSMSYSIDYRKHLWSDFGHIVRNIRTPIDELITGDVRDYLWPVETDPQMIGAYLRALIRHGDALEGFVRFIAVHHVASNIWSEVSTLEGAARLLTAVVDQCSPGVGRDVIRYYQDCTDLVRFPPQCFEQSLGRKTNQVERLKGCVTQNALARLEAYLSVE